MHNHILNKWMQLTMFHSCALLCNISHIQNITNISRLYNWIISWHYDCTGLHFCPAQGVQQLECQNFSPAFEWPSCSDWWFNGKSDRAFSWLDWVCSLSQWWVVTLFQSEHYFDSEEAAGRAVWNGHSTEQAAQRRERGWAHLIHWN